MPHREAALIPGSYYHIYNRGHNGANIFYESANYDFFLRQFKKYIAGKHAKVIAYVLMPNHYHFLLQVTTSDFSHAMQNFSISFVKAMNKRYSLTGALFQGAFQAKLVEKDEYLLHLSRYIHLNPVTTGLVESPEEWIYSSYLEYVDQRNGTLPEPEIVLSQFETSEVSETSEVYRRYREFTEAPVANHQKTIAHLVFD